MSPEAWAELHRQLEAIASNPQEPRERRQKARQALRTSTGSSPTSSHLIEAPAGHQTVGNHRGGHFMHTLMTERGDNDR